MLVWPSQKRSEDSSLSASAYCVASERLLRVTRITKASLPLFRKTPVCLSATGFTPISGAISRRLYMYCLSSVHHEAFWKPHRHALLPSRSCFQDSSSIFTGPDRFSSITQGNTGRISALRYPHRHSHQKRDGKSGTFLLHV